MKPQSNVFNGDCMDFTRQFPDGYFDLGVIDPPYGIGIGKKSKGFSGRKRKVDLSEWDNERPSIEYFIELMRVTKNQIIWGANYFLDYLPPTKCVIFWDKWNSAKEKLADGELAWASFDRPARLVCFPWARWFQPNMQRKEDRIHPTQKPIALYEWLLRNYANPGDKILDTHMGSQSSRIAAYKLGFDYWGSELDADYFRDGCARFEKEIAMPLFDAIVQPKQGKLFV